MGTGQLYCAALRICGAAELAIRLVEQRKLGNSPFAINEPYASLDSISLLWYSPKKD